MRNRLCAGMPALLFLVLLAAFCGPAKAQESGPRQRILLDSGWRFHLDNSQEVSPVDAIVDWRWTPVDSSQIDPGKYAAPGLDTSVWQSARAGDDVFHGRVGFVWMRATLPPLSGPRPALYFRSVDDNATVYLNGKRLSHHEGWNDPFTVPLDSAWKAGGPNDVAVLVENTDGPGGINAPVILGHMPLSGLADAPLPGFDDRSWQVVRLPDDYVVRGRFTPTADAGHASLPTPSAWYRKTFTLPEADRGRSVWIDFDGIYRDAMVYLNGKFLGEHQSGYTGFRYDVAGAARFGAKNVLAVHVDPHHFEGWWYEGGGIYRHVWLNVAEPLHVAPWGTFVTANLPEPKIGQPVAPATLTIQTTLENDGGSAPLALASTVYDDLGRPVGSVASRESAPAGASPTITQHLVVAHPRLWSLKTPRLYRLHTEIEQGGRVVDSVDTPFGIRTIRFDPDRGFFLNGRHVEIQGVCNHQDFAGVGIAVPDSLEYWRVSTLKKMGVNGWRMSHNPPTPSLLDACDHLGMLVMDENRHLGDTYQDHSPPGTPYSNLADLASMILRDRNHPSIIMWSMCNEEWLEGSPEGARIFAAMMRVVHRYDTSRPITCAMNGGWFDPGFATVENLMGVNYNYDVYGRFHTLHPKFPMFGSETASIISTRGEYTNDRRDAWVTSYNLPESAWQPVGTRPFMAGSFAWTGFDYKGEPSPYGWPDINSNYGILDICGFPKDSYYYYQAWWTDKPVVHLMPHWNWPGKEGKNIRVVAFSNAASVDLKLNGKDLGAKTMPRFGHVEWEVPYEPGDLVAVGYDAHGRVIGVDRDETTGAPAALLLSTDRTQLAPDGEDVTVVDVAVVDSAGRVVPTAGSLIHFHVTGAAHFDGVGNGDPSDHDPDKADYRKAFNGLCAVVIQAGDRPGRSVLTVTSAGLKSASLSIDVR